MSQKQHRRDAHGDLIRYSMDQAQIQTHSCSDCGKEFASAKSLSQHAGSVHASGYDSESSGDYLDALDPPFEGAEGEWVYRQDFAGRKSFGFFECESLS
jgi:hypothetical protein